MTRIKFPLFLLILIAFNACRLDPSRSGGTGSGSILPNVSGSAGEVLVVMDANNWRGPSGSSLKELLAGEFPGLPQPEPLFDLIHITTGGFDNLFRRHRTIIISDISPDYANPEIRLSENLWARPQLVIRLNAPNSEKLAELINESGEQIIYNIQTHDRRRLIDVFNSSKDPASKSILNKFYINLAIPRGYQVDVDTDEFAMFSIETARTSQVINIYRLPYTGETNLTTTSLVENRDAMMQKYTMGTQSGSYMITSPMFPVIVYDMSREGKDIIEMRGLWQLNRGFMGGPFVSHTYIDEKRNQIITVEGYVYNPNERKRNMMRHVEAIVYSMEIIE